MDGMHDLGGKQGFGRVRYALNAPSLPRAVGEARQRALLAGGEARHLQHGRVPPRHRAHGAAPLPHRQLLRALADQPRDAVRREGHRHARGARAPRAGRFPLAVAERAGPHATSQARERFKPGDRVRVRTDYVPGHVAHARLHPRQDRRRGGRIAGLSVSRRARPWREAQDEPTYDVRFNAEELWPNSADPALVHVGVFQSYLERAGAGVRHCDRGAPGRA